jgi:hypothetical protein
MRPGPTEPRCFATCSGPCSTPRNSRSTTDLEAKDAQCSSSCWDQGHTAATVSPGAIRCGSGRSAFSNYPCPVCCERRRGPTPHRARAPAKSVILVVFVKALPRFNRGRAAIPAPHGHRLKQSVLREWLAQFGHQLRDAPHRDAHTGRSRSCCHFLAVAPSAST